MTDCLVSKLAVINALNNITIPDIDEDRGFFILEGIIMSILAVEQMPETSPEFIRCEDCVHYPSEYADCPMVGWGRQGNDFCSKAEKVEYASYGGNQK